MMSASDYCVQLRCGCAESWGLASEELADARVPGSLVPSALVPIAALQTAVASETVAGLCDKRGRRWGDQTCQAPREGWAKASPVSELVPTNQAAPMRLSTATQNREVATLGGLLVGHPSPRSMASRGRSSASSTHSIADTININATYTRMRCAKSCLSLSLVAHLNDDLALGVARLEPLEGLLEVGKRPHAVHHRPHPAGLDQPAYLGEIAAQGFDDEE